MTTNENPIWSRVDAKREAFIGLSDRVFDMPELAYAEMRSCAEHTAMLRADGFRVTERRGRHPHRRDGRGGGGRAGHRDPG